MNKFLFVYGTLQRGCDNHRLLEGSSEFCGTACTVIPYPLVVEGLPYLLNQPNRGKCVRGELYSVENFETWKRLDRLEGHPTHYRRGYIEVCCPTLNDDLTVVTAQTYFYACNLPSNYRKYYRSYRDVIDRRPESEDIQLHEHPKMQEKLGIPADHVIIDREVYKQLRKIHGGVPQSKSFA